MRTVSLKISFLMAFTPIPDVVCRETGSLRMRNGLYEVAKEPLRVSRTGSLAGWKRLFENAERALSDNGVRTGCLRSVRNAIAG